MNVNRSTSTFGPFKSFEQFQKFPGDFFYRHTVGRVSMLARIPFYAATLALQFVKMSVTLVVAAPFATLGNWATKGKYDQALDRWTFRGAAKDGLYCLIMLDMMVSSALGVIFGPPTRALPFSQMLKNNFCVLRGDYQFSDQFKTNTTSISRVWKMVERRADYSRHVFHNEHLSSRWVNVAAG